MSTVLKSVDFAALSPLLILFACAMGLLLIETFAEKRARKTVFYFTVTGFVFALIAAYFSPASDHPLITPWIRFDSVARFFTTLFLGIGIGSAFLADSFFQRYEASRGEYYFLLTAAVFGLILVGASADFLTLFLGLETLSIALYIMCGYMKKWKVSSEAAIKYFLMGAFATAFLLYGIALIYGAIGTTQLNGLLEAYRHLSHSSDQYLFLGGIALVTFGLAFKAAIVPFHVWAPDVYDGASNPVTAFMAVGTKAGAFAGFVRVFLIALPQFDPRWNQGLAWLAIVSMVYANFVALRQVQLRRFFAYSSISHAGFLMIPIIADNGESLPSLEFYLVIYTLATVGAFAVMAILDHQSKGVFIKDLEGLFHSSPWLAGIMTLSLLTLAGIPPTAGFFAKFYVVSNYGPRIIESYPSIIVDKRWVQYDSYAGNNEGLGTVAGAVTGGVIGSAFGGGSGKIATVLGGSVLGGFLGNSIGRNSPEYQRNYMFEYTLRCNDGKIMTVLQTPTVNFGLGQPVLLEHSSDGRWFLVPRY